MIDLVTLIGVPIIAIEYFCLGWYAKKIYEEDKFLQMISNVMKLERYREENDDKR